MRVLRWFPFAILWLASPITVTAGQRGPGPAASTNLQVLPKDTPPQEVLVLMQQFTQALGVQCTYCHVQPPVRLITPEEAAAAENQGQGRGRGQGPLPMNFAADDKPQKQVAREMLKLVHDINARLSARRGKPASAVVQVQCVTCHRGVTEPQQLSELLSRTMLTKGEGAAIAMYRDLRQRYYGSQSYDFRENLLLTLGESSLAAKKPDDAVAWLQLSVEFYPRSVPSYIALAQAHLRQRDPSAATRDLEKALEIEPGHAEAKRQLTALRQ